MYLLFIPFYVFKGTRAQSFGSESIDLKYYLYFSLSQEMSCLIYDLWNYFDNIGT